MPNVGPVATLPADQLLVFLLQIGLLLLLALGLGRLAVRLRMPAVVGELLVGVLLGPSLLDHVAPGLAGWLLPKQSEQFHLLDAFAQIGVLLLVGITGAHVDFGLVRRRGGTALGVSVTGLVVPLALGVAMGYLLPASAVTGTADRDVFALFLGVAMCVTAIPVIAKTLLDMKLLHRNVGQLTLAAAVVDDVVAWMLLAVVSSMATTGLRAGTVATSVGMVVAVVLVAATIGRPVIRTAMRVAGRSSEALPSIAMAVALIVLGGAATHALKLEAVFGAFVIGLLMSASRAWDRARMAPLNTFVMSVLAPIFFATAGLRMDLSVLARPAVLAAAPMVLAIAIVGKFAGVYLGARISRLGRWEALALGAGMNARGVVEVVIAMVGLRLGVISTEMYTIIVLIAIVTSLMAPPVLRFAMARVEQTAEELMREKIGTGPADPSSDPGKHAGARRTQT